MLRLRTNVTSSPTISRRSWSATSATRPTSGPRAASSVTISSMPTSWPASTPASTSPTGAAGTPADGAGSRRGGSRSSRPGDHALSRASPSRSDATSTAVRTSGCSHSSASRDELGIDGEARREHETGGLGRGPRSRSSAGHGRSGFTWSMVTGDTPPQSSMPAASSGARSSLRFGGACRCTSLGQDQAGRRDRPQELVGGARLGARASRCPAWAGSSGRSPPARDRARGARSRSRRARRCARRASRRCRRGCRW